MSRTEKCVIRIYNANVNNVVGAGFLLHGRNIVTCAHVVCDALGFPRDQTPPKNAMMKIDFPLLDHSINHVSLLEAELKKIDLKADIALLQLILHPPISAKAPKLVREVELWDDGFSAFGFPSESGIWADGEILSVTADGWYQLVDTKNIGYFIQPGFSGAPVWDKNLKGVVGMVVASDQDQTKRVAYIIHISLIEKFLEGSTSFLDVIPCKSTVLEKTWLGSVPIPPMYRFIGKLHGTSGDHFWREQDKHLTILFEDNNSIGLSFLIDKYTITCEQYCVFLNDLSKIGLIQATHNGNEKCATSSGHVLVVDALDRWKKDSQKQPWLHASKPFGITYRDQVWKTIPGNELLPITLVTWWGARLYSLWVHGDLENSENKEIVYLPSAQEWLLAAVWDIGTQKMRRFPWGDKWNNIIANYSGYWVGDIVCEADWDRLWASNKNIHKTTRPLPVADLQQNSSSIGCIQMIGNVWEWTKGPLSSRIVIKGGAAVSCREHCAPDWDSALWQPDRPYEYIGFRCCYPLRRIE